MKKNFMFHFYKEDEKLQWKLTETDTGEAHIVDFIDSHVTLSTQIRNDNPKGIMIGHGEIKILKLVDGKTQIVIT